VFLVIIDPTLFRGSAGNHRRTSSYTIEIWVGAASVFFSCFSLFFVLNSEKLVL
jgi:hypothetical protein